jgi:tetratricopeptide (TPR) repeat protein
MAPMPEPRSDLPSWLRALAIAGLAALAIAAYHNAAPNALVFDDAIFFPGDYSYTSDDVVEFFTRDTWEQVGGRSGVYRPGLLLTFAADQKIHGNDPAGFHATNIALHALTTLLVLGLLLSVLQRPPDLDGAVGARAVWLAAWLAAALFGLHPVHTDAVDSIFNRSEILSAMGTVGALWLLWAQRERRPLLAYGLGAAIYFAALLCKESAATTPVLLAAMIVVLRTDLGWRARLKSLVPIAVLIVPLGVYLVLRVRALGALTDVPVIDAEVGGGPLGLADRLAFTAASVRDSLRMLVWPFPFRATYKDYAATDVALGVLIHAASAAVFAFALWKGRLKALAVGLAFAYVSVLPSTRLFTNAEISMAIAERYVYLPSVGLALALALGLVWLRRSRRSLVPAAVVGGVALLCLPVCWDRNGDWASNVALFEAEVRAAPNDSDGLRLLANAYYDAGRSKDVAALCDKHLAAHQDNAQLLVNCAVAFANLRRFKDAEVAYLEAGKSTVRAVPHSNLGSLYAKFGHRKRAEEQFRKAIEEEIVPAQKHYRRAQMNLMLYANDAAKLREAISELEKVIALRPRMTRAKADLDFARKKLAEVTSGAAQDDGSCGPPQPACDQPPPPACDQPQPLSCDQPQPPVCDQ